MSVTPQQAVVALQAAADAYHNKIGHINQRVTTAEAEIDQFITDARHEIPNIRISKNQTLAGAGNIPDYWLAHHDMNFELVETVKADAAWETRSQLEKDVLSTLGLSSHYGRQWITRSFNVWRMTWSRMQDDGGYRHTLYQKVSAPGLITVAALTKLVSGSLTGAYWAHGAGSDWAITGGHYEQTPNAYHFIHPYRASETGELLFALPGAVMGHVSFADWWLYPYVPSTYETD